MDVLARTELKDALTRISTCPSSEIRVDLSGATGLDFVAGAVLFRVHSQLAGEGRRLRIHGAALDLARTLKRFGLAQD